MALPPARAISPKQRVVSKYMINTLLKWLIGLDPVSRGQLVELLIVLLLSWAASHAPRLQVAASGRVSKKEVDMSMPFWSNEGKRIQQPRLSWFMVCHSAMGGTLFCTTDTICELGWKSLRNRDDTESETWRTAAGRKRTVGKEVNYNMRDFWKKSFKGYSAVYMSKGIP